MPTQPWTPRVSLVVPPHMLPSGGAVGSAVPPQPAVLQDLTSVAADVISQLWEEIGAVKRRRKGVALGARALEQLLPPRECPAGCMLEDMYALGCMLEDVWAPEGFGA